MHQDSVQRPIVIVDPHEMPEPVVIARRSVCLAGRFPGDLKSGPGERVTRGEVLKALAELERYYRQRRASLCGMLGVIGSDCVPYESV